MKKFFKYALVAVLAIVMAATVAGCGSKDAASSDKKVLKVATEAAYAPFEYKEKDGTITGFDVEYIKAIAKEMGYDAKVTHIAWDGLIPALDSGSQDVVISAMTITDERKKSVLFSDPYLEVRQYVALRDKDNITSLKDLKGKVLGAQNNTTGHYWAAEFYGVKPEAESAKVKKFDTSPDALEALKNGSIDAAIIDGPVVLDYIKNNPNAHLKYFKSNEFKQEYYGIAIKKDNSEMAKKVSAAIKKLKENGTYDKLVQKYFPE